MLQTGAAFGVASLGGLVASGYTHGLPASVPAASRRSLIDALTIAANTHSPRLLHVARHAFVHGMQTTLVVSAAVVLAGAVIALLVVRDRSRESVDPAMSMAGQLNEGIFEESGWST